MRVIHPLSPDTRVNRPLALKLLSLLMAVIISSPIPRMIAFSNPDEADVLGRYTSLYFGILLAYLAFILTWLLITTFILVRLTPERLSRFHATTAEHSVRLAAGFFLPLAALWAFRIVYLMDLVHLPDVLDSTFQRLPALVGIIWCASVFFLIDESDLKRFSAWLLREWGRQMLPVLALGLVGALHLALVLDWRTWDFPLGFDSSTHVYLGQHLLRGGIPYRTVYYSHPPMRFVISGLWAAIAQLLGLPAVTVARAYDILISLGVFAAIYGIGKNTTGHPWGGALSAGILLGTEFILTLTIYGPTFRLSILLLALLGIWFAQKERYVWAGVFATLSVLTWMPALTVLLAILGRAAIQRKTPRWKSILLVLSGMGSVLILTALPLAATGALQNAIRQNVLSVFLVAIPRYTVQSTFSPGQGIFTRLRAYQGSIRVMLHGDWEIAALLVLGFVMILLTPRRNLIDAPARLVVWLAALLMIGATWLEFDATVRDAIMLIAMFVPLGAAVITDVLDELFYSSDIKRYSTFLAGILCFALIFVGFADAPRQRISLYNSVPSTLGDQIEMVSELEPKLAADDTIQSIGAMWVLVLSNRDNATPYMQFGPEAKDSLQAMNLSKVDFVAQLAEVKPLIIMMHHGLDDQLTAELDDLGYEYVGRMYLDMTKFSHKIFVRRDRPDLKTVIMDWPLIPQ